MPLRKLTEVVFTTDVPLHITVRLENGSWRVVKVVVDDENLDLDLKHVRAVDPDGQPLTVDQIRPAFDEVETGDWPAWQFGF